MSIRRTVLFILPCVLCSLSPSLASASHGRHDATIRVQVTHSEPVYEAVRVNQPIEECWHERVPAGASRRPSRSINLLGAIAGGALGRHLGDGGQEEWLGTVVGGVLGHTVTDEIQEHRIARHRRYPSQTEVCRWSDHWETRRELVGYEVTYEFAGREFTTFSETKPGATMEVALIPSG